MRSFQCKDSETTLWPIRVDCLLLDGTDCQAKPPHGFLDQDDCRVVCCLAGKLSLIVHTKSECNEYTIHAGRFGFYTCPGGRCHFASSPKKHCQILQMIFPFATLSALIGERILPHEISHTIPGTEFIGIVREITPPMNRLIGSIQEGLKSDIHANLLVSAKALELLWLFCASGIAKQQPQIRIEDRMAIQEALIILQNHLDDPPSLKALANRIGMSVSKLKTLFPKTCGIPPYEYLRKIRMEKAMVLLIQGDMNVTEVAMEVGYSSVSHFTKVFHKEFAIYPSQVRNRNGINGGKEYMPVKSTPILPS